MNLFKKLFAPSGDKVELTERRSWTVSWPSLERDDLINKYIPRTKHKVFTDPDEAGHFKESLKQCIDFLGDSYHRKEDIKLYEN